MDKAAREIVLRADGDSSIGMGHITRLLAMAEMLNGSFRIRFATRNRMDSTIRKIKNICDDLHILSEDEKHYSEFINLLSGDEIVVLDNYFFSGEYQEIIRNKGCRLVCIDDIHDRHYFADIVINHSPGIEAEAISAEAYTSILSGPDYAVLRRPFLLAARSLSEIVREGSVFVCFGGSDPYNLTRKVVKSLVNIVGNRNIIAVTGSSYRHSVELGDFIRGKSNIALYSDLSAAEMVALIRKSELAIVPASSILMEVLCFNIKVITGFYADNQKQLARGIAGYKPVTSLGDFRDLSVEKLSAAADAALNTKLGQFERIIDGNSDARIRQSILSI